MKANPASPEATSNYGTALRSLKRDGEAVAYFDRALILLPGYVPALVTRGASLQRLERREEALKSLDRAVELDPLDREDSPWYPSARLFRHPDFGDWKSVIDRMGRELASFR
jgi:tetratricopeptide (TPR) repeat protein